MFFLNGVWIRESRKMMTVDELAEVALLMATLPPHVAMLDVVVLTRDQSDIDHS